MKKCIDCIWRIKVNESVSLCPFVGCMKTVDKNLKRRKNKNSKNKIGSSGDFEF